MNFYLSALTVSQERMQVIKIVTIVCMALIVAIGIIDLFLCVFNVGSFRKHKKFFLKALCGICLISLSVNLTAVKEQNLLPLVSIPMFLFGVGLLIYLPISFFNEKTIVISESDRNFVRALDKAISEPKEVNNFTENNRFIKRVESALEEKPITKITAVETRSQQKTETVKKEELNFSHVKNVLERLNYYNLSPVDKKIVGDLRSMLFEAERVGVTAEGKSKLNEGLCSLLKIMSKYSV